MDKTNEHQAAPHVQPISGISLTSDLVYFCPMAGIYIHIPFCRKACHYCNFHFSTSFQQKDAIIRALLKEIDLQIGYLEDPTIDTIYFGGGTPSAVPGNDIGQIILHIRDHFNLNPDAEITLEANPEDIHDETLQNWRASGINRLSIGIQSFQDDMLKAWNRVHDSAQAYRSLQLAKNAGFENISADLIYGDPLLTDDNWKSNIQRIVELGIPHISSYALTVEPGTALAHQIDKGKSRPVDEEQSYRQYAMLQALLKSNGYEQYEISNFAKPDFMQSITLRIGMEFLI